MVAISNINHINRSTSFNYKFVNLPNLTEISSAVVKYIPENYKKFLGFTSITKDKFSSCTPLVEAVETIRPWHDVDYIALITVSPYNKLPTHIDWDMADNPFSLNIPIFNCAKTPSVFYKLKNKQIEPKIIYQDHGDPFYYYDSDQTEEVERFYLTKAAFFNTQIPHSAINDTNETRIMISVRFKTPLKF
jgi:hypothetical protein